jgi:hypothetical protein
LIIIGLVLYNVQGESSGYREIKGTTDTPYSDIHEKVGEAEPKENNVDIIKSDA